MVKQDLKIIIKLKKWWFKVNYLSLNYWGNLELFYKKICQSLSKRYK